MEPAPNAAAASGINSAGTVALSQITGGQHDLYLFFFLYFVIFFADNSQPIHYLEQPASGFNFRWDAGGEIVFKVLNVAFVSVVFCGFQLLLKFFASHGLVLWGACFSVCIH